MQHAWGFAECAQNYGLKSEGKMSPGRSRCRWEYKHEIDLKSYNKSVD